MRWYYLSRKQTELNRQKWLQVQEERARHSVRKAEGKIKSKQPLSTKLYPASILCLSVSEWVMMIAIN